ncbi:SusC/RagA family TonB-linked outer membrane protein [Pedobacter cryoconitis]|uniref:Iron complex outermembrane receptor protein n=1 Tax=Pedobacter cryoconitis TaxID=188932 RepID=A0A327SYA2_9SPHI|nr:SusC/RagA family TonB-linked outer membrane protein [Pedobacter cryoconitis]RAJ30497.1 iron complex outermembrane receptor protein [Pedobacter cryoconitis]
MKVFYVMRYCLLLVLTISAFAVQAQTGAITGKIIDETGLGLPGASVLIKGQGRSGSTDAAGNFKIVGVPNGPVTLTASYIGYSSLDLNVTVKGNTVANFSLKPDAQNLNEVVVIGYGTSQKKDLTGSITTVSSKDFQAGNITSPEQLIAGKVAGVSIVSNGGQPGSGSVIRIRGGASLTASNDPLIVIDGVPFGNNLTVGAVSGNVIAGVGNPLSLINPNDIETFTVLKDANATAIYGSRASNGVILITTKKGKSGALSIDFSTVNSYATVAKKVDVLSADQIRDYVNANGTAAQKALLGSANTDWQNVIYNDAFTTDNNLSISGSFKKVPYRISGGYLDQKGLLRTDRMTRATAGITLNPTFFDNHLKVDLNLKGSLSETRFANTDAVSNAISFDPTQPVYANNAYGGYYEWIGSTGQLNPNAPKNPLGLIQEKENNGKADRSFGNLRLDYSFHFLPELHFNVNGGYDVSKGYGSVRVPAYAAQSNATLGTATQYEAVQHNKVAEAFFSYIKDLKGIRSNINATAGYGFYENSTTTYNFTDYNAIGTVQKVPVFPYDTQQNRLLSYYGRLVYTFADKYIFSGTMRADGSSKFSEAGRWGYFPSAGFTWRAIDESFLKDSKVFSDLKMRLSYGITGQQDGFGNYTYLPNYYKSVNEAQYQIGNQFYHMFTPIQYDKDLKWETSTTYNAGIDYGLFGGRVYGSVDVYYKKTKDLLSLVPIAVGTNFSNQLVTNVGNMENKGIEASINVGIIKTDDVKWDMGFNFTYNKNKVTNLSLNPDPNFKVGAGDITGATGTTLKWNAANYNPGSFLVYKQVYNAQGKPLEGVYADLNNDGIVNDQDRYFYKSPVPKFILGFTTSFSYKKLTLSTVLRGNIGNYIYDNVSSNLGVNRNILSPSGLINNASSTFFDTNFTNNQYLSDYYIHNASFLKMDNAGLAYNFGRLSPNSKTSLRITANVQNVFIISKYKGIDPESTTGIDYNLYPRPRTYSLGLNVGF